MVQKDAEFDVTYNDTVTSENQTIYAFNHTVSRDKVSSQRHPTAVVPGLGVGYVICISSLWVSDRGSARVRGRVVAGVRESHLVCGPTEASCAVFSSPSHTKRPVSIFLSVVHSMFFFSLFPYIISSVYLGLDWTYLDNSCYVM